MIFLIHNNLSYFYFKNQPYFTHRNLTRYISIQLFTQKTQSEGVANAHSTSPPAWFRAVTNNAAPGKPLDQLQKCRAYALEHLCFCRKKRKFNYLNRAKYFDYALWDSSFPDLWYCYLCSIILGYMKTKMPKEFYRHINFHTHYVIDYLWFYKRLTDNDLVLLHYWMFLLHSKYIIKHKKMSVVLMSK